MTEQKIQAKLIKQLEADGYYVLKLSVTNKPGIPDLIAIPKDSDAEYAICIQTMQIWVERLEF